MQNTETKKYIKIAIIAVTACLFVRYFSQLLGFGATVLGAATPLILGAVLAYIVNILMVRLEKLYAGLPAAVQRLRRPVCLLGAFALIFIIAMVVGKLVLPELLSSIELLAREVPPAMEWMLNWAIAHSEGLPALQESLANAEVDWGGVLRQGINLLISGAGGVLDSIVALIGQVVGAITTLVIALIFSLYLLASKERLQHQALSLLQAYARPQWLEKILYVVTIAHRTFTSFLVGQCTEAVILGLLCAGGMLLLRFPYAAMTGAVVGVTALIPVVGAYIGAAVGGFMIFTQNPLQALAFLAFLVVLQQLEGNLIYPRVVGSSVGLPGLWVLAAVTVGGGIMGILGMLLAVPLAATVYKLTALSVRARLASPAPPTVDKPGPAGV